MKALRLFALCLASAGALASVGHATVRPDPVKLRLVGPAPVVHPGERVPLQFELVAREATTVSRLEVSSASLASPFLTKAAPQRVDASAPMRIPVEIDFSENTDPLVVRYEIDGEIKETSIDLTPLLASERAKRSAMVKVSDDSINPEAGLRPDLVQSLPVPTGEDDPEVIPLSARSVKPQSAQGRNIRVRGRIIYSRLGDGKFIGADQVWVRAMDEDYGPDDTLASGYTDSQGYFDMTFFWDQDLIDWHPDLYIKVELESPVVTVETPGLEIDYSFNSPTVLEYMGPDYQLGAWAPADHNLHGAVHIYTNIRHNYTWYWGFEGIVMPSVDVQWPDGSTGAEYNPFWEEIHISSERTWREDTHAHEYGHHFMNHYAPNESPEYCNGICDVPTCGHCMWCQETDHDALNEGWPNWIAHVQTSWYKSAYGIASANVRNMESIEKCGAVFDNPEITEGFIGAILQDIWDSANEMDPGGLGRPDALALDWDEIFDVMRIDKPKTPLQFMNAFRARFPQHTVQLWQTAYNNRWDLDLQAPSTPTGFVSSDHTIGVPSVDATIAMSWNPSTDEWSGIESYDFLIDRPDPLPDTSFVMPSTVATTYHLPPGTYTLNVRARDRSGWTSPYATSGPYQILAPTPADLAFTQPAGWARRIVPRPTNNATTGSVPDPTTLVGNSASTYFNYAYTNAGQQAPLWGADSWLLVDGGLFSTKFTVTPAPGAVGMVVNRGPFTIRGGRHHIGGWLDTFDQWSESNEANNVWGRPWVWTPIAFTGGAGNNIRRDPPPGPTDGWWTVTDGSPLYYTCDGIRWGASTSMNLVWMAADQDTSDFDARLHFPTTGPNAGFDVVRGSSVRGPGCLEALMVNRNVWNGDLNWDIGVTNANGGGEQYLIARRGASSLTLGAGVWNYALPDSEYAVLFELYLGVNDGPTTISAQGDPEEGPFYLGYFGTAFAYGGLSDPGVTIYAADSTGLARFQITPAVNGRHGIVLFRDPKDGRGARTIDIWADPTPPDMVAMTAAGFHSPVVPQPAYNGHPAPAPLPDTLYGDSLTTYIAVSGQNASIAGIPGAFTGRTSVDGVALLDYIPLSATPGQIFARNLSLALNISGGRHTVTLEWDFWDAWPELYENNNDWGEQYVWRPKSLSLNTPVTRAAPPDRTVGWDLVSSGEPLYFNVDGVRTPVFAAGPSNWAAVTAMPGATSDVDLQLHEVATTVKDGFASPLSVSAWGEGHSEHVLVCFAQTAPRAFDVGIANPSAGVEDYTIETLRTSVHPFLPEYGPLTVGAGRTLRMIETLVPAGSYTLRMIPLSGTADLGLSVHAPTAAYQAKSDAVETAWLNAAGEIEELQFTVDVEGPYCFAVWKVGSTDLAGVAEYRLELIPNSVDVVAGDVPAVTQLAPAAPSPFGAQTTIAFDLAREGSVALEVFDVRGARVRTLAKGAWQAGRHRISWDGRDDAGGRLGAGVYFVRLATGGQVWNRKVVRLE